jgi:hypothetical protein
MLQEGFKIDITSFWVSTSGNGGPTISPYQMRRLADLEIEIWWDIYFYDDEPRRNEEAEQGETLQPPLAALSPTSPVL